MPQSIGRAVTVLVGLIPGLAILVFGLGVPTDSRLWFVFLLEVVAFSAIGVVMIRADEIKQLSTREVARKVVRKLIMIVVILSVYFVVHQMVIATYISQGKTVTLLVPAHVRIRGASFYVYGKCDQPAYKVCKPSSWDTAYSAHDVAQQVDILGEAGLMIEPSIWRLAWSLALLGLYAALVWHLVYLFGLVKMRGADIWQFLKAHT